MNRFRGLIHSQRVLLALTQKGVSREDAYALVQRNAMKVWEQGADFQAELAADPEVRAALSEAEIAALFDLGYHTRHVDTIFARVFGARLSAPAPSRRSLDAGHPAADPRQPARRGVAPGRPVLRPPAERLLAADRRGDRARPRRPALPRPAGGARGRRRRPLGRDRLGRAARQPRRRDPRRPSRRPRRGWSPACRRSGRSASTAAPRRGSAGGSSAAARGGLALIDLPSSSPAYAAMPFAEKRARWCGGSARPSDDDGPRSARLIRGRVGLHSRAWHRTAASLILALLAAPLARGGPRGLAGRAVLDASPRSTAAPSTSPTSAAGRCSSSTPPRAAARRRSTTACRRSGSATATAG